MSRTVAVVTYSPTDFDSRVRRIVAALAESGREVHLLSPDVDPQMAGLSRHSRIPPNAANHADVLKCLIAGAAGTLVPFAAASFHRMLPSSRAALRILRETAPDAIHANDWCTLPAAVGAARTTGSRIVYDSHENAVEEHAGLLWWRLGMQRSIRTIESQLIRRVHQVVTIGEGLGQAIKARHGDAIPGLTVVYNVPDHRFEPLEPRDGEPLNLVYAGVITPERRLDVMIRALAMLPAGFRLTIIGFGPEGHLEQLRLLAQELKVADRVSWRPPVPPEELVPSLAFADIGIFVSSGETGQQQVALPNKIFEYTAAGLGIVAVGSSDAKSLLLRHGHGVPLDDARPEALADTLRTFDRTRIEALRTLADAARRELSWSREKLLLLDVYDRLGPRCAPPANQGP